LPPSRFSWTSLARSESRLSDQSDFTHSSHSRHEAIVHALRFLIGKLPHGELFNQTDCEMSHGIHDNEVFGVATTGTISTPCSALRRKATGDSDQRFFVLWAFGIEKTLHFGWLAQAGECSHRAQPHRPHLSPALKSSSI
jgi:hypothetical protein